MVAVTFTGPQPVTFDPNIQVVHSNATVNASGSITTQAVLGTAQVELIINITGVPTGTSPTLQFSIVEVDPVDLTTPVGSATNSNVFNAAGYQIVELTATKSSAFKVSWTIGGTSGPTFTGVNVSVSSKSGGSSGSGGTVTQGNAGSIGQAWYTRVTDGTNGPVAVKAASTAALGTDPSFVVALSPNSPLYGESFSGTYPQPNQYDTGSTDLIRIDSFGNLSTRSAVFTDEGSLFDGFSGSSLFTSLTGTVTFTNGSSVVTGSGTTFTTQLGYYSYIKLDAHAESAWARVVTVDSDTQVTLAAPYTGANGSGASSKTQWVPVTGSGGAISVASSQLSIASGGTNGSLTGVYAYLDYPPVNLIARFSITQRIANQTITWGLVNTPTNIQKQVAFVFTGTDNTQVICRTSVSSSANDTQSFTYTLPNGGTTATQHQYSIYLMGDGAQFMVDNQSAAFLQTHIPEPYGVLQVTGQISNQAAVTTTTLAIDAASWQDYDRVDVVARQPIPGLLQVTNTPAVDSTVGGSITGNGQIVQSSPLAGVGTVGIQVTGTWAATLQFEGSIDGTTWVSITGRAYNSTTVVTNVTGNGLWRFSPAGLQYIRVRCSAFTSGTAVVSIRTSVGSGMIVNTETVTTALASTTLSGTANTIRGNVTQYTADGTAAAANSLPVIAQLLATKVGANTLDRLWAGPTNADGEAVETVGALVTKTRLYGFNGTTWDRLDSSAANGLIVDVSRVQGTVTVGGINAAGGGITGNPVRIGASDGANTRDVQSDTSGNLKLVGVGTAGTPVGGVVTVQGAVSMTALKVDGSGVTQPISGSVTANIGTTNGLALDATLTGGTQTTRVTDGTNTATVKAASTAAVATDKALVVAISPNNALSLGGASTPADAFANPTTAMLSQSFLMGWNGTTWDRLKSTTANGLAVDVTRVQGSVAVTGTFWQATQPVSLAAAVDVSDRAGRLLGVVYGSLGQQLKQTATNFNLASELYAGGTAYDARQVRALTSADVVTAAQATAANLNATVVQGSAGTAAQGWFTKVTDGTNSAAVKGSATAPLNTDSALVVTVSPNSSAVVVGPSGIGAASTQNPVLVGVTDTGGNARYLQSDTSGRPIAVGAGTAGSPVGGVLSVQGVSGGTTLSAGLPDISVSGAFSSASSNLVLALGGRTGLAAVVATGGTGNGGVTVNYSSDGGVTYYYANFLVNVPPGYTLGSDFFLQNPGTVLLAPPPGTTHVKIISSGWTSGSTNVTLTATQGGSLFSILRSEVTQNTSIPGYGLAIIGQNSNANTSAQYATIKATSTATAASDTSLVVGLHPTNNSAKITDGTNTATVKAASTAAVAADKALVVVMSPNNTGTVGQGTGLSGAAQSSAWLSKLTDGTNGIVAVKAASTAAVATDPALVVALSPNIGTQGLLPVTLGAPGTLDVFGHLVSSDRVPQLQANFYQAAPTAVVAVTTANGGGSSQGTGYGIFSTGASSNGSVQGATFGNVTYSAHYEVYGAGTCAFTVGGIATSTQRVGLFNATDGLFFGYNATAFGVGYLVNGGALQWTAQASWNTDTCTGQAGSKFTRGGVVEALDPTKLNFYRVRFGWLGIAPFIYEVLSPDGNFVVVHVQRWPNLQATPSIANPNLPFQLDLTKTAGNTNIVANVGCWVAGVTAGSTPYVAGTGTITANGGAVQFAAVGVTAATINITGTWNGTLAFQYHIGDNNWITDTVVNASTLANASTTTANGAFKVNLSAARVYRVTATAWTSGTASIAYSGGQGTGSLNATITGTTTSNQGTANTLANAWPTKVTDGTNTMPTMDAVARKGFHAITDGTNGPAAVKAASTAAVAADPALVVTLSPNNPMLMPPDVFPGVVNITARDVASTSTAGANGQVYITGSPTANSSVAWFTTTSYSSYTIQVTGSWTGTLQVEVSYDGGTTYFARQLQQVGVDNFYTTFTSNFTGVIETLGATIVRVRSVGGAWTGTATVKPINSFNQSVVHNISATRLSDNAGNGPVAVKAASTAAAAADPALVVAVSPNNPVTQERLATGNALATAAMTTSSSAIVAANANRKRLFLRNTSTTVPVYVAFGQTATTSAAFVLAPGQVYSEDTEVFTGTINGITASGSATVAVQELQA